jgi:hypothetical protein
VPGPLVGPPAISDSRHESTCANHNSAAAPQAEWLRRPPGRLSTDCIRVVMPKLDLFLIYRDTRQGHARTQRRIMERSVTMSLVSEGSICESLDLREKGRASCTSGHSEPSRSAGSSTVPESSHGWCMEESHGQSGKTRCVQKHICSMCMASAVNSTYNPLFLKNCLSIVTYFCKHCLAEALDVKGNVDPTDFREKSSCLRHREKNQNKKCDCCPHFKDRTYCITPSNPDLDSGTRNCFLSTPAKRRCACVCKACTTLKAQRKEEQLKAAQILKVELIV